MLHVREGFVDAGAVYFLVGLWFGVRSFNSIGCVQSWLGHDMFFFIW